jgi:hypothetical protein
VTEVEQSLQTGPQVYSHANDTVKEVGLSLQICFYVTGIVNEVEPPKMGPQVNPTEKKALPHSPKCLDETQVASDMGESVKKAALSL